MPNTTKKITQNTAKNSFLSHQSSETKLAKRLIKRRLLFGAWNPKY
ncbi:hypothetical protein ACMAV3_02920 [Helicobacter pylori]